MVDTRTRADVVSASFSAAAHVKKTATALRGRAAVESVTVLALEQMTMMLKDTRSAVEPVMRAHAAGRIDVNALAAETLMEAPADVAGMWQDVVAKGEAVIAEVATLMDAAPLASFNAATGRIEYRSVAVADTATLRTLLDALIAALP